MSEDRIERETLIAAPIERVWPLVAEPGFWATDENPSGTVAEEGQSAVATHSEHGDFPVRVEKSYRRPTWRTAGSAPSPEKNCATTTAPSWSSR